jgi:hypothetical protein
MQDLIEALLQLAAVAVLGLGGFAIRHLADWLKLRADSEVRDYLQTALDRAVEFGLSEARRRVIAGGLGGVNVAAEIARDYAQDRVPGALARFAIDTSALDQMIRARLPSPPRTVG